MMPELHLIQGGKPEPCEHEFQDATSWRQKLSGRRSTRCRHCGAQETESVLDGLVEPVVPVAPEAEVGAEEATLEELTASMEQLVTVMDRLGNTAERAAERMEYLDKALDGEG